MRLTERLQELPAKKIIFITAYILFFIKTILAFNPDLGWHIRLGNYILENGIPHTDPFSFTMPSYHYVDHEWLSNVLIATLYPHIQEIGLALIFAALAAGSLVLSVKSIKNRYFLLVTISTVALLFFAGIRIQVIGWIFFSVLLLILSIKHRLQQLLLLPLLFLVWANMHGSFPLGLLIASMYLINDVRTKKASLLHALLTLFVIIGATLINPYGLDLYKEPLNTVTDISLYWKITEWIPIFSIINLAAITYVVLALFFFLGSNLKKVTIEKIIFLFLLLISFLSVRHFPFFLFFSLPLVASSVRAFEHKANRIPYGKVRFAKSYFLLSLLLSFGLLLQIIILYKESYMLSESKYYPTMAVNHLQSLKQPQNIFTQYNWAGYVLMKVPTSKVFIDGRMPSWNNPSAPLNESTNAFEEYEQLLKGELSLRYAIEKYSITSFVLPIQNNYSEFMPIRRQLMLLGWEQMYSDQTTVIFLPHN